MKKLFILTFIIFFSGLSFTAIATTNQQKGTTKTTANTKKAASKKPADKKEVKKVPHRTTPQKKTGVSSTTAK